MRTWLLVLLLLSPLASAEEGYALGFNLGVAQLRHSRGSVTGTAWSFQANYEADDFLSFFGQAGQENGTRGDDRIRHNLFGGGVLLSPLPFLMLKAGLSLNTWEANLDGKHIEKEGLSPLAGAYLHQTLTGLSYGAGISGTRTGDFQSVAMTVFLMVEMF